MNNFDRNAIIDKSKQVVEIKCNKCGSYIGLTKKLALQICSFIAFGYIIADIPEILQTRNDVEILYEAMNTCMSKATYYERQRRICACALMDSYESFKFFNPKKSFQDSLEKCKN